MTWSTPRSWLDAVGDRLAQPFQAGHFNPAFPGLNPVRPEPFQRLADSFAADTDVLCQVFPGEVEGPLPAGHLDQTKQSHGKPFMHGPVMDLGLLQQTTRGHHSEWIGESATVHEPPEFLSTDDGGFAFAYRPYAGHSHAHPLDRHLAQDLAGPTEGEQPLPSVAVGSDDFHQPTNECQYVSSFLPLVQQRSSGQVGLVRISCQLCPLLMWHQSTKRRQRKGVVFAHAITVEEESSE
ncbi:hypothetical protein M877_18595 [Streptomyces niveus NCIMB 11891]|nr:hypothetical protein M877_18595 [Streptomyces niveus NCIMB 11891]